MSIYRGNNRLFFNHGDDVTSSPAPREEEPRDVGNSNQPPAPNPPPPEIAKLRKAIPATALLPESRRWLEQLPEEIRPNQLARDFPRIGNNLCAAWREPDALRLCAEQLLVGRRGNRKGFPAVILNELHRLFSYYDSLYPQPGFAWELERLTRGGRS